jgi:hypothetical protein
MGGGMRNAYKILMGKVDEKDSSEDLAVHERKILK